MDIYLTPVNLGAKWGVNEQLHAPTALFPWEHLRSTLCVRGWMIPRASLEFIEKR
jgi:hypothetical protein